MTILYISTIIAVYLTPLPSRCALLRWRNRITMSASIKAQYIAIGPKHKFVIFRTSPSILNKHINISSKCMCWRLGCIKKRPPPIASIQIHGLKSYFGELGVSYGFTGWPVQFLESCSWFLREAVCSILPQTYRIQAPCCPEVSNINCSV